MKKKWHEFQFNKRQIKQVKQLIKQVELLLKTITSFENNIFSVYDMNL